MARSHEERAEDILNSYHKLGAEASSLRASLSQAESAVECARAELRERDASLGLGGDSCLFLKTPDLFTDQPVRLGELVGAATKPLQESCQRLEERMAELEAGGHAAAAARKAIRAEVSAGVSSGLLIKKSGSREPRAEAQILRGSMLVGRRG